MNVIPAAATDMLFKALVKLQPTMHAEQVPAMAKVITHVIFDRHTFTARGGKHGLQISFETRTRIRPLFQCILGQYKPDPFANLRGLSGPNQRF
ncbi:MAG: hypothetical protein U1F25_20675, partial [Rubrivivax sp.]